MNGNCGLDNQVEVYVSVIIPVFNCEKYLLRCLQTLQKQTLENFEVIMVDDGSTDGSNQICVEFQERDRRFRLYQQNRQFAGAARNFGIEHSRGEYLLFLDSDDFFSPELLEKSHRIAKKSKADVCVFGANSFDDQTSEVRLMKNACECDKNPGGSFLSLTENADHIFDFTISAPWNKIFRRNFIVERNIRFQRILNANDVCFVLTALATANYICVDPQPLIYYRINHGTSLQQSKDKDPTCICEALLGLQQELIQRDLFGLTKASFMKLVVSHCIGNLRSVKTKKGFKKLYEHINSNLIPKLRFDGEATELSLSCKKVLQWNDLSKLSPEEYIKKYSYFEFAGKSFQITSYERLRVMFIKYLTRVERAVFSKLG